MCNNWEEPCHVPTNTSSRWSQATHEGTGATMEVCTCSHGTCSAAEECRRQLPVEPGSAGWQDLMGSSWAPRTSAPGRPARFAGLRTPQQHNKLLAQHPRTHPQRLHSTTLHVQVGQGGLPCLQEQQQAVPPHPAAVSSIQLQVQSSLGSVSLLDHSWGSFLQAHVSQGLPRVAAADSCRPMHTSSGVCSRCNAMQWSAHQGLSPQRQPFRDMCQQRSKRKLQDFPVVVAADKRFCFP